MRKSLLILASLCSVMFIVVFFSSCGRTAEEVEISFDYVKQNVPGSNQWAVWIENSEGEMVKTLYVSRFTAKGRSRNGEPAQRGYVFRPACVPMWQQAAQPEKMSDEQMDAISGATPVNNGLQIYVWDFTDVNGAKVPKGTYKFFAEFNLRNDSQVVYCGTFSSSERGDLEYTTTYTVPDNFDYRDMVSDFKATVR